MPDLRYEAPGSLADAVKLLAGGAGPATRSGGRNRCDRPDGNGPDRAGAAGRYQENPGYARGSPRKTAATAIGAAVSGMEMCENADFCAPWPGLIDGVKLIGSIQVKGRATMTGNLCNASPGADSVPPLVTAGAIARVVGPDGARDVPVEKIPVGPGKTSLARGEMIESFFLPARPKQFRRRLPCALRRARKWTSPSSALRST